MLYAASADLKVTSDEKEAILEKVNEKTFNDIWKEYHSMSDINKINLIISYKGLYFPTADRTNELLDLMKKEFMADGEYSLLEKNRKCINPGIHHYHSLLKLRHGDTQRYLLLHHCISGYNFHPHCFYIAN